MDELSGIAFMFESGKSCDRSGKVLRNRLSLPQRIDVIKLFHKTQDINHLAHIFQCGPRQIKNTLRKRKKYLDAWAKQYKIERSAKSGKSFNFRLQNAVGIVLNEWIQRARCYQINITNGVLRNFAKEIANNLKLKSFEANDEWINDFKKKFALNEKLLLKQEVGPRRPLGLSAIIDDLRRQLGTSVIPFDDQEKEEEDLHLFYSRTYFENLKDPKDKSAFDQGGSESIDSAVQLDIEKLEEDTETSEQTKVEMECAKEIGSYREALNCLGPLEQFALLKENIRAVGLINQLENLFRDEMIKDEL